MTTDIAPQSEQARALAEREDAASALAHILATGDVSKLTNEQRVAYYLDLCRTLGLEARSRPFDWLQLDGKLVLYPNKSCTEQLRRQHQISVKVVRREMAGELYVVEVEGRTPSGRVDFASKYVPVTYWDRQTGRQQRLAGDKLANAYAKAETGAKRRLVLSMVGLAAVPDPDEVRGGRVVVVDGTGAVVDHPTEEQRYLADVPAAATAIGAPTYESTAAASGADAPVPSTAEQAARPDEVARPATPDGPHPTFKPGPADVKARMRRWHAMVDGTDLESDEGRHRFFAQWTDAWTPGLRTDSLATFAQGASRRQWDEMIAHAEVLASDQQRALAEARGDEPAEADDERPF